MTKLKFLKNFEFFEILSKFYIKVLKNGLILNKNFPEGPQVEGALWDSRPPASHGEASDINFLLSIFFYKAGQVGWETDLIVCSF